MPIVPRDTDLPLLARKPLTFVTHYRVPLLVLLVGATADLITTYVNLQRYGSSVEAHPVQRLVSELVGASLGVPLAKLIQLAFVLFVAAWWRPWCGWILAICGVLYSLAAVSNHFLLL